MGIAYRIEEIDGKQMVVTDEQVEALALDAAIRGEGLTLRKYASDIASSLEWVYLGDSGIAHPVQPL